MDPNNAPAPAVTAMARALQKATRKAPVGTFAPPACADSPPRISRHSSEAPTMTAAM